MNLKIGNQTAFAAGSPLEPFLLGYGSAIFGSLVAGFLDHTLMTYPHAVALLWLTLGLGAVSARLALREREGGR